MNWMHSKKGWLTLLVAVVLLLVTYRACSQSKPQPQKILQPTWYNENDPGQKGLNYKFRGVYSGEVVVDGFGEKDCVVMHDDLGEVFFNHGRVSVANQRMDDHGVLRTPATLRVIWRALDDKNCVMDGDTGIFKGGTLTGDYTVPIASRIPDELLEEIRKNGGRFRLKIRLADDGPLIGWDIEKPSPYYNRAEAKRGVYFPPSYVMAGGDFREADIFDGKPVRKGWYIDKKTGQKIETEF
jgi:hypothetical protein